MNKPLQAKSPITSIITPAVIVAALGYFVDIYDLLLFSIVRVPSLKDLHSEGAQQMEDGILLLNSQMIGMLIGGVLWGILGDKRGRLSVLFGSIVTYSVANICNGFVDSINAYAFWRFIAGIGLAGELGAGITLVSEVMPKEKRGYATTLVASIGIAGAVFAGFLAEVFTWRTCYFIGGGLGLALLLLRAGVTESGMFKQIKQASHVQKGNFMMLFGNPTIFARYLRLILIGLPVWYVVGILITFSPEFAKSLAVVADVNAGKAVMFCYGGMVFGDIISGSLSQFWRSRKKVLLLFWAFLMVNLVIFFVLTGLQANWFYVICGMLGFSVGSWVVFMTSAAEQFGTNIRATVTTTVPNFVRGSVVPLTYLFLFVRDASWNGNPLGVVSAGVITGILCLGLALWAILTLNETFSSDLDFNE